MPKNVLADTGFWFALYNSGDAHHEEAQALADYLGQCHVVIPWPCLYETLNTKFVKNSRWLDKFFKYACRSATVLLPDEKYRDEALSRVANNPTPWQPLSLVDVVLMLVMEDPNIKIDAVAAFDKRHFRDFCYSKQIELLTD